MAIDVRTEVVIRRSPEEVAAFMFEPKNDAIWTRAVEEVRPLTEGPLRPGSKVERVVKFLGRRFGYLYEVTDADARSVEIKVDDPFPMFVRYELQDAPEGTLASIRTHGDATGFFRVAAPLMARMVRRNISRDLQCLKEHLEGDAS